MDRTVDQLLEAAQYAHAVLIEHGLFHLSEQTAADNLADAILAFDVQPRMPRSLNEKRQTLINQRTLDYLGKRIELRQQHAATLTTQLDQLEHELSIPTPEPLPAEQPAWLRELMDK